VNAPTIIGTTTTTTNNNNNIIIIKILILFLVLLSTWSFSLQLATAYSGLKLCCHFETFVLVPIRNLRDFTLFNIDFKRRYCPSARYGRTLRRKIPSAAILAFSKNGLS